MLPAEDAGIDAGYRRCSGHEIAAERVGTLKIAKLNVDDNPDIARRFDVMSIPTLILFKDGEPAKRIVGARGKSALLSDLAEFL